MRHHQDDSATESPVSFDANVTRLPQKGLPVVVEADAGQRAALAEIHGLLSVESYRAELLVTSWKRNGIKVNGTVTADITQECIVTLEPLQGHIREDLSAVFLPEDSKLGRLGFGAGGEMHLDAEGPDSPETFSGDTIDVGALAEEFFGLAIDPYPRKPGASLAGETREAGDEPETGKWQEKLASLTRKP